MKYIFNYNADELVISFEIEGETYILDKPMLAQTLESIITGQGAIYLASGEFYSFTKAGGTAETTDSKPLLEYVFTTNKLLIGTELTEADDSIPAKTGNKGFLTSTAETPLLNFYKVFAYNEDNYKLIINSKNVEVSFLCSDRRYGVAGSRRGWSPYFKIRDLIKQSFTDIQNRLVGSDATPEYFFKAKITVNANGNLFITVIDGHSGVNLYGAILNIRHRII